MPRYSEHEIMELFPTDKVNEALDGWVDGVTEAMDLGHSYNDIPNFICTVFLCDRCSNLHNSKMLLPEDIKGKTVFDAVFSQLGDFMAHTGTIPIAVSWVRKRHDDERMRVAVSVQTADGRDASAMVYIVAEGATCFVELAEMEYCKSDCNPVHSEFIENLFDSAMDVIEEKGSVDLTEAKN